jgi:hypothetical protein
MRYGISRCGWALLTALSGTLFACAPLPPYYTNTANPQYGAAEYQSDLQRCRTQSSAAVVTDVNYEISSTVRVNELQVGGCMARHGWQQVSNSNAWSPPLYWS